MQRHDGASQAYETAGLQTLELAPALIRPTFGKTRTNKRPMKTVVSISTFGRESLSPTSISRSTSARMGHKWRVARCTGRFPQLAHPRSGVNCDPLRVLPSCSEREAAVRPTESCRNPRGVR
jgi:hypothetical protein